MELYAYHLVQQIYGRFASEDSLWNSTRVCLEVIPSADMVLQDLGTFAFITGNLFSAIGMHETVAAEFLRLIERI